MNPEVPGLNLAPALKALDKRVLINSVWYLQHVKNNNTGPPKRIISYYNKMECHFMSMDSLS